MKWVTRERPKIDRIATALILSSLVSMSLALTAAAGQTRRSDSMMRKAYLGSVGALALVLAAVGASSVQTMQRVPWP